MFKKKNFFLISMYSITSNIAQWGLGFNYLKYKAKQYHAKSQIEEKTPLLGAPLLINEEEKEVIIKIVQEEPKENSVEDLKTMKLTKWQICVEKSKDIFDKYISPPVVGNILGMLTAITGLSALLYDKTSFFSWFGDSLDTIGKAQVPIVLLVLGVNMGTNKLQKVDLKKITIFLTAFIRFILMPILGICLVFGAILIGMIPKDQRALHFVLMLEAGTPSALNLVVMCSTVKMGEAKLSYLQFWVYIISIFSLTLNGSFYLYLIHTNWFGML